MTEAKRYRLVGLGPENLIGIEDTKKQEIIGRFSSRAEATRHCDLLNQSSLPLPLRFSKKRYPNLTWWQRRKLWYSNHFGGTFSRKEKRINIHLPGSDED